MGNEYKMIAPDGGYGHIVNLAGIINLSFSLGPSSSFALIFGPFLSQYYDEGNSVTIVTSIYITLLNLSGLLVHFLINKLTNRKVAIIGSLLYTIGSFLSIFANSLVYLTITYGIMQGMATGFLLATSLTSVNAYFDKKKSLSMAIGQTIMVVVNILYPGLTRFLLDKYGFRGTQLIFTGLCMHVILGALMLHPVEWYLKKQKIQDDGKKTLSYLEEQQLLKEREIFQISDVKDDEKRNKPQFFDYELLKKASYWNLTVGLAISVVSDTNFMSILPVSLYDVGLNNSQVTLLMTFFFASDVIARVALSLFTAFFSIRLRCLFFFNVLLTILLKTIFTLKLSFVCLTIVTCALGFSRSLIQTPVAMVIGECYSSRFTAAYSFYMVLNGTISIIMGAFMGLAKHMTGSHLFVLHILTSTYFFCVIPWGVELGRSYLKSKRKNEKFIK